MTTTSMQSLPEYEKPPVAEMVCGVLFKPIEKLLTPYIGLLWEKFKPEYSGCQEVAPLAPVIESFSDLPQDAAQMPDPILLPRVWFTQKSGKGIIQIQRDRFLQNWMKAGEEEQYPRYHTVIGMFRERLSRFQEFLNEAQLGIIEPLQYEMTYVNHIPQGDGWETMQDIGEVFPDFAWKANDQRFLSVAEGVNWRTSFALPNHSGRLHVTIRNAKRRDDNRSILLFDLTARGIGRDASPEAMWSWFDLAHEWIVCGFADLTHQEIQKNIWRKK